MVIGRRQVPEECCDRLGWSQIIHKAWDGVSVNLVLSVHKGFPYIPSVSREASGCCGNQTCRPFAVEGVIWHHCALHIVVRLAPQREDLSSDVETKDDRLHRTYSVIEEYRKAALTPPLTSVTELVDANASQLSPTHAAAPMASPIPSTV